MTDNDAKTTQATEGGQPAGEADGAAAQPTAAAAPSAEPAPDVAPEQRVTALEAEVASLKDQLLRAMAETENVRRRAQREREDTAKFAVTGFAKDMLPVADNLRRALEAVPEEARENDEYLKNLVAGVEATERQLLAGFEKAGIKKLEPIDQPFDPNYHQVMFQVENTGKPGGTVVQILQAGYTLNSRLLREAMVGVAKNSETGGEGQRLDTSV